jgi:hypothetical protein
MATAPKMGFVGRAGNAVYYWMGNTYCMRALPRKYKQTRATRAKASVFGRASTIASCIRQVLYPVIPNPTEREMQTRLVSTVFEWLNAANGSKEHLAEGLDVINRFAFNERGGEVLSKWNLSPAMKHSTKGVRLDIPSFIPKKSLRAPAHTVSVTCRIALGVCNLNTDRTSGSSSDLFSFAYDSNPVAENTLSLELAIPKGSLLLAAISLEYTVLTGGKKKPTANKAFMPAGIVQAILV